MKKLTLLFLPLILLLTLVGCKNTGFFTDDTASSNPSSSSILDNKHEIVPIPQQPMVSISLSIVTETERAQDGTVIFVRTYQNIAAVLPDPNVCDAIILDFLNRVDNTEHSAQSILDAAKKDYTQDFSWQPYTSQILYEPMRLDRGVISLFGSQANSAGSAHPEIIYETLTYDLSTGDCLSLSDIINNTADLTIITNTLLSELKKNEKSYCLYPDYTDSVRQRFNSNFLSDQDWYFNRNGICFFFSPYEIAPYASGVIQVTVPYEALSGILEDAYFPDERLSASGKLTVKSFDSAPMETFSQISEIVLQEQSNKFFLYTDGAVYDLQMKCADSDGFYYTVFAAECLSDGDAVMVEADNKTQLQIIYQSNGVSVCKYLKIQDNSCILTDVKGA